MTILTLLDSNKSIFFPHDCKNQILVIDYDHKAEVAGISIYESLSSVRYKLSLWQKIKSCFQILLNGSPFYDQLNLNKKQLKELYTFLAGLSL